MLPPFKLWSLWNILHEGFSLLQIHEGKAEEENSDKAHHKTGSQIRACDDSLTNGVLDLSKSYSRYDTKHISLSRKWIEIIFKLYSWHAIKALHSVQSDISF